jgi:hypothetical protein
MTLYRTPQYIDLIPATPITAAPITPRDPLVHVATATELRATIVVDPIVGDQVSCADLVQRDRDCWRQFDAQYPPRDAYALSTADRERSRAARGMCAVRRPVLLRVCRFGGVRAG